MNLDVVRGSHGELPLPPAATPVPTRRVPPRDKRIRFEPDHCRRLSTRDALQKDIDDTALQIVIARRIANHFRKRRFYSAPILQKSYCV